LFGPDVGDLGLHPGNLGPDIGDLGLHPGNLGPDIDDLGPHAANLGPDIDDLGPHPSNLGPDIDDLSPHPANLGRQALLADAQLCHLRFEAALAFGEAADHVQRTIQALDDASVTIFQTQDPCRVDVHIRGGTGGHDATVPTAGGRRSPPRGGTHSMSGQRQVTVT
jgi:hypothetical protein